MANSKRTPGGLSFVKYLKESELKSVGEVERDTLILGDCLKVMPYIADGSVSAIITDLPYG
jgi:DNA modification methylase